MNRFPKTQDLLEHDRGVAMSDTAGHARADQLASCIVELHSALSRQLQVALRYKSLPLHIKSHGLGVAESIVDDFKSARQGHAWDKPDAVELLYEHWMESQPCMSPSLYQETKEVLRESTERAIELRYGITVSQPTHGYASAAHSLGRSRGEDGLETARARQRGSGSPYTPEGRF